MHYRLTLLSAALLLSTACNGGKNETQSGSETDATVTATDTDSGTSTSTATATDPTSTGATDGTDGTGSGSDGTGITTTGNPPTTTATEETTTLGPGTTTESVETTGAVDPGVAEACAGACALFIECGSMPDRAACNLECTSNLGDSEGACLTAVIDTLTCIQGLTCEQALALLGDDDPGPCLPQATAQAEACEGGGECIAGIGGEPGSDECSFSRECRGEPSQEMSCVGDTCTCLEDGQEVGDCPAQGVCEDFEGLQDKAGQCCGF